MVTHNENGLVRVTVTLDPEDVRLLDKLAAMEGKNRSWELRGLLEQVRPMIAQLVHTFESASAQRMVLDDAMTKVAISNLEAIMPEVEDLNRKFMGAMAKLEGAGAASAPASNTGATLKKNTEFPGILDES